MAYAAKAPLSHSLPADGRPTRLPESQASARFSLSNKFVFTARQNVMFFALLQIVYIDTMHHHRDNPTSLRCSNCFLIVSPLFLLCRLGAGIKPRAFFLPAVQQPIHIKHLANSTPCCRYRIPRPFFRIDIRNPVGMHRNRTATCDMHHDDALLLSRKQIF